MTANISQVTAKNIPPSSGTLSLLYIWTLPEALENRSILRRALNVPTFHLPGAKAARRLPEKGELAPLTFAELGRRGPPLTPFP